MPAPYSLDLRRKALESYLEKGSLRKTAERFGVPYKFVQELMNRYKTENAIEPKPHKSGDPPKVSPKHAPFLEKIIEKENDLALREICSRFEEEFSISVSISSMNESLGLLGISRKKNVLRSEEIRSRKHSGMDRLLPGAYEARSGKLRLRRRNRLPLEYVPAIRALSPIGKRACSDRPTSKGNSLEGTMNGSVFAYYMEHFLVEDLRPGMTVVFDDASPHKNEEAPELIEKAGAEVLFLPPYRPELNPIEYCWSKIKGFLGQFKARTKEALYDGYSMAIKLIDAEMAKACFGHCGV